MSPWGHIVFKLDFVICASSSKCSCSSAIKVSQNHSPRLSAVQRARAVDMDMSQLGATREHIARTFGCSRKTIVRPMQRLRQGQTADGPRSGRLLVTIWESSTWETGSFKWRHQQGMLVISRQTVSRRLGAAGILSRRPYRAWSLPITRTSY